MTEREAFEQWVMADPDVSIDWPQASSRRVERVHWSGHDPDVAYKAIGVQLLWEGWQARAIQTEIVSEIGSVKA